MSELRNTPATLLIHGLGGTAYDLGEVPRTLEALGHTVYLPTLPGHAGEPLDLLQVGAHDWLDCVTAQYRELRKRHRVVHLGGLCLGALLALEVAKREGHRDRLILMAPTLFLDGWGLPKNTWMRHFVYPLRRLAERMRIDESEPYGIKNDRLRKIVRARFSRGDRFHYPFVPLATIREVDRLRGWVRRGLDAVTCPTLLVYAREDEITSPRSAHYLSSRLGGELETVELANSYHMLTVDNERALVNQSVHSFVAA
jgi:carboxylesterase